MRRIEVVAPLLGLFAIVGSAIAVALCPTVSRTELQIWNKGNSFPNTATTVGTEGPSLPWHLAQVHWSLSSELVLKDLSVDFVIMNDLPDSAKIFIVPISGIINESKFYAGCITNIPDVEAAGVYLTNVGRGLIFTRWGDMEKDSVRLSTRGYRYIAHHEGEHASVRLPYRWTTGKYTLRLVRMECELRNGIPHTWLSCFLKAHANNEEVCVGEICFQGEELSLRDRMCSFVEVYDHDQSRRPTSMPEFSVAIGNVRINDQGIRPTTVEGIYLKGIPRYANIESTTSYMSHSEDSQFELPTDDAAHVFSVGSSPRTTNQERVRLFPIP